MTARRLWGVTALLIVFLIVSLAFAMVKLGWKLVGHTTIQQLDVTAVSPTRNVTEPHRDITAIVALAPFGQAITAPFQPKSQPTSIPLNFKLRGVLVDPDPEKSRAFLLMNGRTSTFVIGDNIQSGALVAITADTITLNIDGRLQTVGFNGLLDGQVPFEVLEDVAVVETPIDPFARLAASIVSGNGSIDLRDPPPPETTQEYIRFWRTRIIQNPRAVMETVGVELAEGGYKIKDNPNIGVTLAGLRPGDLITRLNGQSVGDIDHDRRLYDDVAAAGVARLEVLRNGKAMLLSFPLN